MFHQPVEGVYLFIIMMISFVFFKLLEKSIWVSKKWTMAIITLPAIVIVFCVLYWEECRAQVFFFFVTIIISVLVSSLSGYAFTTDLMDRLLTVCLWPIYVTQYILHNA